MRFAWRVLTVALLAALVLTAWRAAAGRGGEPQPVETDPPYEQPGGLIYTLSVEPTPARAGDSLRLCLEVVNREPTAMLFEFPGGLEFDFTVARDGVVLWQWSRGRDPASPEYRRVLAPGATLEYAVHWDGRDDRGHLLEPGRYEVRAVFLGDPEGVRFAALTVELL